MKNPSQLASAHLTKQSSLDIEDNNNIYNLNEDSSPKSLAKKIERLQDPSNYLKKSLIKPIAIKSEVVVTAAASPEKTATPPTKRLLPLISELNKPITTPVIKELQKQYSSSSSSLTQTSVDSKPLVQTVIIPDGQIEKINENESSKQRYNYNHRALQLLHTDSLSSDPSDSVSQRNSICLPNTKSQSAIQPKKLPSILPQKSNTMTEIKRSKIKTNKQYSLSSSDECDYFEVDDVDEEIRSTTEYNDESNDEMDLESGSISDKGIYLKKLDIMDKHFEKEEILAEKMKKFLSVSLNNNNNVKPFFTFFFF